MFIRRIEILLFQWNLTAATIRAITVTKTQAAAQIAAWMKLTLKHTLYGHLGVMQVNWIQYFVCVFVVFFFPLNICIKRVKKCNQQKTMHLFFILAQNEKKNRTVYSINIISHCMVIAHEMWKQYAKLFLAKTCTCSRTCQWHFSFSS